MDRHFPSHGSVSLGGMNFRGRPKRPSPLSKSSSATDMQVNTACPPIHDTIIISDDDVSTCFQEKSESSTPKPPRKRRIEKLSDTRNPKKSCIDDCMSKDATNAHGKRDDRKILRALLQYKCIVSLQSMHRHTNNKITATVIGRPNNRNRALLKIGSYCAEGKVAFKMERRWRVVNTDALGRTHMICEYRPIARVYVDLGGLRYMGELAHTHWTRII